MQCVVPFCEKISKITPSQAAGITFHRLPSEEGLRAAWLKALGTQDTHLSDSAVVCSRHFLNEDIYVTESGEKDICPEAIPSTVLVCMACLDTDSELLLLSKHKLQDAYEQLTGHPCDLGNLQQTLCVQCAQTVRDFSRFREQSLRARSLMMHLLQTHGLVTMRHLELIKREGALKSESVTSPLEADDCDSHMEHDADNQTAPEEDDNVEVKTEPDSLLFEEEIGTFVAGDPLLYPLKCEDDEDSLVALPSRLATNNEYNARATEVADTTQRRERARATDSGALHNRPPDSDDDTRTNIKHCVVVLYDVFKHPNLVSKQNESLLQTRQADSSCDNLNTDTACKDAQYRAASESEVAAAHDEPAASALSDTEPSTSGNTSCTQAREKRFICDVCQLMFRRKHAFIYHVKTHSKSYACKNCEYKSPFKSNLIVHMWTHTGEKPISCKFRKYKSSDLARHTTTHTGEKPFSCKLCEHKSASRSALTYHMRTHTGEKPYSCKLCGYKFTQNSHLASHMRTHTGEKPFSCKLCKYKCAKSSDLARHTTTHTGEKPFSCKLCEYKCARSSNLVRHTRTHTGEKPFSCKLCKYKCGSSSALTSHMKKHTGEKPYACKYCEYKSAFSSGIVSHIRIHTGEKPFSCKLCEYKSAHRTGLTCHIMRTHTSEKPFSRKICENKFT